VKTKLILLALLIMFLSLSFFFGAAIPAQAQTGPTPTPTLTSQEMLSLAKQIADDANTSSLSAVSIAKNADSAVNTSNNALKIAAGASLIGVVLVSVIAGLGFYTAWRTFLETRADLVKAKVRIEEMRTDLRRNTEQVRTQSRRAIQGLALMQLGEQQVERRNLKGAVRMYEKAFTLDPDNRATRYFLGDLYVQDGQLDRGIENLNRVGLDSDYAPAEAGLGLALRLQGDRTDDPRQRSLLYVQAEERLLRALQIDPTALDIYGEPIQAALGELYKRQGRLRDAILRFEEARLIAPESSYAIVNLAVLYYMQGDRPKSQSYVQRIEAGATTKLSQKTVDDVRPLEGALQDLERLKNSPHPPDDIDILLEQFRALIQKFDRPGG